MAETKTEIQEVGEKINDTLDEIIRLLRREKPSSPLTKVWYSNGSISSFNIVGELGENSIPDKMNAVSIEIGPAATSIGINAFRSCSELTSVTIGNSVTSIESRAFQDCSGLMTLTIPDSVTSIGSFAFYGCSELMSISFYEKTTTQVQEMSNYSWNFESGCTIYCADGEIFL